MGIRKGGGRPPVYKTSDGKRVPGVTTILSRFKDSGGLIHWAWEQGRDGKDYRESRDQAASAGHIAHAMIEAHIHGEQFSEPSLADLGLPDSPEGEEQWEEAMSKAKHAYEQFLEWRESTKFEIIATEVPLVSERYRFGGTIDAIAVINGKVSLLDWKSSNAVYGDYIVQVGAYRQLWEEHNPEQLIARAHLLRVAKDADAFAHHSWGLETIQSAWSMFEHLRAAYDIDSVLRKAAA